MPPFKPQKIDLSADYPCPCGRKGRILPITLTDALGCNRCQHIFTIDEKGYYLEQLSTTYSGKKAWYWTGSQWSSLKPKVRDRLLSWLFSLVLILLLVGMALIYFTGLPLPILIGVVGLGVLLWIGFIFYRH